MLRRSKVKTSKWKQRYPLALKCLLLLGATGPLYPLTAVGITGDDQQSNVCVPGLPPKQAVDTCTKVLSLPDIDSAMRVHALLLRASAYLATHDLALASVDYETAQKITYSPNVGLALSEIDLNIGKDDEAVNELSKIVDAGNATAQIFNLRGAAFQNTGDFDASIADFNNALLLNPKFLQALTNRAAAYAKKGDYKAAVHDIDIVLTTDPNMPTALVNRCELLAKSGNFDQGRASCDKAEHLMDPNNYYMLSGLGIAYYEGQHFEEAIQYYDRSLQMHPHSASTLYLRGVAKSKLGKEEESKSDISEAERLQPGIAAQLAKEGLK